MEYAKLSKHLPALTTKFPTAHPLRLPGNKGFVYDTSDSFLKCPINKGNSAPKNKRTVTVASLLLTRDQLKENQYPDASSHPEYWELSPVAAAEGEPSDPGTSLLYAMDCEMVQTKSGGLELARCSVTDSKRFFVCASRVHPRPRACGRVWGGGQARLLAGSGQRAAGSGGGAATSAAAAAAAAATA